MHYILYYRLHAVVISTCFFIKNGRPQAETLFPKAVESASQDEEYVPQADDVVVLRLEGHLFNCSRSLPTFKDPSFLLKRQPGMIGCNACEATLIQCCGDQASFINCAAVYNAGIAISCLICYTLY